MWRTTGTKQPIYVSQRATKRGRVAGRDNRSDLLAPRSRGTGAGWRRVPGCSGHSLVRDVVKSRWCRRSPHHHRSGSRGPDSSLCILVCLPVSARLRFSVSLSLKWSGDSSVVRASDSWSKVPGSSPGRSGGRIFFSRVNFLCWHLFRYPFHPRVTAVARKRSRLFYQKCRWQVTAAKHTSMGLWKMTL